MNVEKYTERVARVHPVGPVVGDARRPPAVHAPEHFLKVLLDDRKAWRAGLIDRAGGNSRAILKATEAALSKMPKVSGGGAGQIYLAPATARAVRCRRAGGRKGRR